MSFPGTAALFLLLNLIVFVYCKSEDCGGTNLIEGDIDNQLTGLAQDDPIVIDALKNYYLDNPNDFPINLDRPTTPASLQVRPRQYCYHLILSTALF